MPRFSIIINEPNITFSALHCLTFTDTEGTVQTENVHGHDFRVCVKIYGPLNGDRMVMDFIEAHTLLLKTIENFNHRFLLPLDDSRFLYEEDGDNTKITFNSENMKRKYWSFPSKDLYFLHVSNVTTEELALQILSVYIMELIEKEPVQTNWTGYEMELVLQESPGMAACVTADFLSVLSVKSFCEEAKESMA